MNWLYFTVMGYIITSALRGYHRGFLRVVYSIVSLVAAIVFIAFTTPVFRDVILDSTTIAQQIEETSEGYIRKQIDKKLENGTWKGIAELSSVALPKSVQKELNQAANASVSEILESQRIYKKMAKAAADLCVTGIALAAAWLIIWVILHFVKKRLDRFSRKPGIHLVNMILGFFAGIVKAFLVVWVAFLLIRLTQILPYSAMLLRMIEENAVLQGLYEKNVVLELIQKLGVLNSV